MCFAGVLFGCLAALDLMYAGFVNARPAERRRLLMHAEHTGFCATYNSQIHRLNAASCAPLLSSTFPRFK
jgi:hypothetical protein